MFCLHACMSMHHLHAWCSWRSEEIIRSLGTGVKDGCETLCGCWEFNLRSSGRMVCALFIFIKITVLFYVYKCFVCKCVGTSCLCLVVPHFDIFSMKSESLGWTTLLIVLMLCVRSGSPEVRQDVCPGLVVLSWAFSGKPAGCWEKSYVACHLLELRKRQGSCWRSAFPWS